MTPLRRVGLVFSALVVFFLLLSLIPVNPARLHENEARRVVDSLPLCGESGPELVVSAPVEDLRPLAKEIETRCNSSRKTSGQTAFSLTRAGNRLTLASSQQDTFSPVSVTRAHWSALIPALLAVALAIATRLLLPSLLVGLCAGALLHGLDGTWIGPLAGASVGTGHILYSVMTDEFHVWIFVFTFSLIGMVNVMSAGGGIEGVARLLTRIAGKARSTQAATALMGLAVFFDDYSNAVVVGASMRPLSDRARIAREKLAFLIDSTAAPVAGLAVISTWIGYEIGLIGTGLDEIGLNPSPFSVFLAALPFRFYCIFTLLFIAVNVWTGREYGSMREACRRALDSGEVLRPGSHPLAGATSPDAKGEPRALGAILPVAVVIASVLMGMVLDGAGFFGDVSLREAAQAFDWSKIFALEGSYLTLGENGAMVLAYAALLGSLLALVLGLALGGAPFSWLVRAWFSAGKTLLLAFGVLILAWALGHVNGLLGTSSFIVSSLAGDTPPWALPVVVFFIAGGISFATGSSWGTMAVLLPAVIPLAHHVGGLPLLLVTVGTVLDGSIFGDHCSPLSDTTIMASIAANCDHIDHVRTQFPYSFTIAVAALGVGYLWVQWVPPWVSYLLAPVVFFMIFKLFGRRVYGK